MFSLPRFSIKRPVCIFICIASLIIFGVSSVFQMPMESTPEMEFPVLMVMTSYYGASPEEIDESVTDRVEAALATVSEVQTTMSVSYENMGMTMLQFDYGADLDKKFQDVSSALALVSLPDGASDPTVMELNISNIANSSVMTITVEADAGDNLKAYVEDTVVPELERIEGVSDVSVSGGSREYVQVLLDENKLTQYHLTMNSVATAIASSEFEMTMGSLDRGNVTVDLTGSEELEGYRSLEDVPIILSSGDVIRLSDVAQVNLTDEEMTAARQAILSSLKTGMDSPGRLEDYALGQVLLGRDGTMADLAEQVRAVTAGQVAEAARRVSLDTVYFLEGVDGQ